MFSQHLKILACSNFQNIDYMKYTVLEKKFNTSVIKPAYNQEQTFWAASVVDNY